jgi:C-methyltransferase
MLTTAKVPSARLARVVEWIRHYLYRLHQRLVPAPAAMMEMIIAG